MALNAIEQLTLLEEGFTNLSRPLGQVVYQQALTTSMEFVDNKKDTSPGGTLNEEADVYYQKMSRIVRMVQEGNKNVTTRLMEVMIARVGTKVTQDLATVQGASETQVLGFLANNMLEVLENFALVSVDEKTAYDAL